ARGGARPRARARAAPRLPREPAADAGRDAALLPPGRVVVRRAHPRGARALLRRPRRRRVRQRAALRRGAALDGGAAPLARARAGLLARQSRGPDRASARAEVTEQRALP